MVKQALENPSLEPSMAAFLSIGVLLLVFYFLFRCFKSWRGQNSSRLPTNWPVIGMVPGLVVNSHRIHDFATEILQECGCTFYFKGALFCNGDMLLTCDPANIHYILSKNFANFSKGPDFKEIFDILGDGIFNSDLESWEVQRKTAMSLLNHQRFQKFVAETTWSKVEKGLIPILERVVKQEKEMDLQDLFERLTFDSTCILVLGHDPASLCIELPHIPNEEAFGDVKEAVLYRHILPEIWWKLQRWLQIGKEKKLSKASKTLVQFVAHCISQKREELKRAEKIEYKAEGYDLLTNYIKASHGSANSDVFLKDTLLNFLFAGRDTISAALTWFFWLLATNPVEKQKIREEITPYMQEKENGRYSNDRNFNNLEELKKLIYLHGGLCESLRLFPPVALQHKAPVHKDILPSGHFIDGNTKTLLSFYSMGRMETIWGKDCLEFKPGRWISEKGGIKHEPSFKFTAFNAGPRSCLGKDMSFIQMKIVAATIIYQYDIEVVEGHPICASDSVILHMKHGLKVRVTRRESFEKQPANI